MNPATSSSRRPKAFTALLAAGMILIVVLAVVGRHPVTHALALLYVATFLGAVAGQAAGSREPPGFDGKT